MRHLQLLLVAHAIGLTTLAAPAQTPPAAPTAPAVTEPDALKAINLLRNELVDAFNKGDVDRLLSHLDPDVVATWQNGEVTRGPQGVRGYYNKMMTGPDRVVATLSAKPVVDDRHVYDDGRWAVSWGNLHDEYVLLDGTAFKFDSRFTATIARRGDVWKVTSFHASVSAFDNPILGIAARKAGTWAGVAGAAVGVLAGVVLGVVISRRKRKTV
jgi:ketosteroid isomerase-like protein